MAEWLVPAVESGATIVTANLRLARELARRHADAMVAEGHTAWRTPQIEELGVFARRLASTAETDDRLLLGTLPCQVLWEQSLADELQGADANIPALAREAQKARSRLVDYDVPIAKVGEYARTDDQRLFASTLNRFVRRLDRDGQDDAPALLSRLPSMLLAGDCAVPESLRLVGFSSPTPLIKRLVAALKERGCAVEFVTSQRAGEQSLATFVDDEQELKAAGAWARRIIDRDPEARLAIVVSGLAERRDTVASLVREGFCPGWQIANGSPERLVNLSYGRRLAYYPAVSVALLSLRWLTGELSSIDIGILLKSEMLGSHPDDSRLLCELALREIPTRDWSVTAFQDEFCRSPDALTNLIERFAAAASTLGQIRQSPDALATAFYEALKTLGWPGETPLSSDEFQLINRWREVLNDFARLRSVEPGLSPAAGIKRLSAIAADAVFQAETTERGVDVLGPLEALGMEFDGIWLSGVSADVYPGIARPNPLLARELQIDFGMPEALPESSQAVMKTLFDGLVASSNDVIFGFAQFDEEAERSLSPFVPMDVSTADHVVPPWFAERFAQTVQVADSANDEVPPVGESERVFGGISTIDRQANSPFDAFAAGRLGLNTIMPYSHATSPRERGNLVHDALSRFYAPGMTQAELAAWTDEEADQRAREASFNAFQSAFHARSAVQTRILRLEEARMRRLLKSVWRFDCEREHAFSILSLEEARRFAVETLELKLRADRIDRLDDGGLVVLDYKTGGEKRLVSDGELQSYQLVLYAMVNAEDTAAIGFYNINATGISIKGDGTGLAGDVDGFNDRLRQWQAEAVVHSKRFIRGDVRVLAQQQQKDSRKTRLLSRAEELKRGR